MRFENQIPLHSFLNYLFSEESQVAIEAVVESNIFREHQYVLHMQDVCNRRQDHYGLIQCSNLISLFPKLAGIPLFKIHITWFQDAYVVYATHRLAEETLYLEDIPKRRLSQCLQKQFRLLGIIESNCCNLDSMQHKKM